MYVIAIRIILHHTDTEKLEMYNMKNVDGLQEYCQQFEVTNDTCSHFTFLFEVEKLIEEPAYEYAIILNKVQNEERVQNIYEFMYSQMFRVCHYLFSIQHPLAHSFSKKVFHTYAAIAFQLIEKDIHLLFLLNCMREFVNENHTSNAKSVIRMIFNEL